MADDAAQHEDRGDGEEKPEELEDAKRTALLEGRSILIALTTLFGFQTSVVFTETFAKSLDATERGLHLGALALTAIAVGAGVLPPAYGRQAEPRQASRRYIRLSSRALVFALGPTAISLALTFGLIARLALGPGPLPHIFASILFAYFVALWFVYPRIRAKQLESRGEGAADEPGRRQK